MKYNKRTKAKILSYGYLFGGFCTLNILFMINLYTFAGFIINQFFQGIFILILYLIYLLSSFIFLRKKIPLITIGTVGLLLLTTLISIFYAYLIWYGSDFARAIRHSFA